MSEAERKERLERLKADAEKQKPIKEPETDRTEQDSRRTNPEVKRSVPQPTTLASDESDDPKQPFI